MGTICLRRKESRARAGANRTPGRRSAAGKPDNTLRRAEQPPALRASLTGKGRKLEDEAVGAGLAVQSEALAALTEADRAALDDQLRALLAELE